MSLFLQVQNKFISFLLILFWTTFLYKTDSYHSVYTLCSLIAIANLFSNNNHSAQYIQPRENFILNLASGIYSLIIIFANWTCFSPIKINIINLLLISLGGFCIAQNILSAFFNIAKKIHWTANKYLYPPHIIFPPFLNRYHIFRFDIFIFSSISG